MSSWVGREEELEVLLEGVREGGRWTAIVGAPGVGKTRLMREAVVLWPGDVVEMTWRSGLSAPEQLARLRRACGLEPAGEVGDVEVEAARLGRALDARGALCLALDDVEPGELGWLVPALTRASTLRVVSTSYTPCPGTRRLSLGPLRTSHEPEEVSPAATLFLECCPQARRSDAEALARRADGVPLAILLLARRARVMGAERLAQASAHEVTAALGRAEPLREAVAGLWSSLTPQTRDAARWCATFDGSFASEDGARLLARAGHAPWETIEALEGCGLLELEAGPRLRMLRPLRAFVLEHTERDGCQRELAHVLAERAREEVERAWCQGLGSGLGWWRDERDHLLGALGLPGTDEDTTSILAVAGHTFEAFMTAPPPELRAATTRLIERGEGPWVERLRAYRARHTVVLDADVEGARLALDRVGDAEPNPAWCALTRARIAMLEGQDAVPMCREAVAWSVAHGYVGVELEARMLLGMVHQWSGRRDEARGCLGQVRALAASDPWAQMMALALLGQLDQLDGDLEAAADCYEACWALRAEVGLELPVFPTLAELMFLAARGDHARVLGRGEEVLARPGAGPGPELVCRCLLAWCHHALGDMERASAEVFLAERLVAAHPALEAAHGVVLRVLLAAMRGAAPPEGADRHLFASMLANVTGAEQTSAPEHLVRVGAEAVWFERAGHERRSLRRRHVARRVFQALCQAHQASPGRGCTVDALIEAAWPGERLLYASALTRLRVLVHGLRELGLRDLLQTVEGGYALGAAVTLQFE